MAFAFKNKTLWLILAAVVFGVIVAGIAIAVLVSAFSSASDDEAVSVVVEENNNDDVDKATFVIGDSSIQNTPLVKEGDPVQIFLINRELGETNASCGTLVPVDRALAAGETMSSLLLAGPTAAEARDGIVTYLPPRMRITIMNSGSDQPVIKLSRGLYSGFCEETLGRRQIERTFSDYLDQSVILE